MKPQNFEGLISVLEDIAETAAGYGDEQQRTVARVKYAEKFVRELFDATLLELVGEIEGLKVDREATKKHIESCDISDEEKESYILNMEVEADDTDELLSAAQAIIKEKQSNHSEEK